jgi:hypothetical protein
MTPIGTGGDMRTQDGGRSRWIAATAAAVGVTLAGCGSTAEQVAPPSTAPPPAAAAPAMGPPSARAVAWTDSVCGALVPVVENLVDPPGFDITAPAATRDAFSAYLAQAQAAAGQALEDVTDAGAAPVDGGAEVAEEVRSDVIELRDDLADARSQVEQADPDDPAAIGRAVVAAGNIVGAITNSAQALAAIDGDPRLDAAYAQADSCERLRAIGPTR